MISLRDACLLSFAKIRSRKLNTFVTVLLAGIIFGLLIAVSLIATGTFNSIERFRDKNLTGKYIVNVSTIPDPDSLKSVLRDPVLLSESKSRYQKLVKEKNNVATKLNIEYSSENDKPPYTKSGSGEVEVLNINDPNRITQSLLAEKYKKEPAFNDEKLNELASRYQAKNVFSQENYSIPRGSSLTLLHDGKENFPEQYDSQDEAPQVSISKPSIDENSLIVSPSELTRPFLYPNNAGWTPQDGSIPIVLPKSSIEQIIGLKKLPGNASISEKHHRLQMIRASAASLTIQSCYRNSVSIELVRSTIEQNKLLASTKKGVTTALPALTHTMPDPTKCENPIVKSDTRAANQKERDTNQKIFDEKFNNYTSPISQLVTFKVVGMSPDSNIPNQVDQQDRSLDVVVSNLLSTSGIGQTIPQDLYKKIPENQMKSELFHYTPLYLFGNEDNKVRYVEFANSSDAEAFIDEQGCTIQYDNTCLPAGRSYQLSLSFTNSVALDDIRSKIMQWLVYSIIGAIGAAGLIMSITIGRTLSDGRQETAILRAIGFKRIDIATIYIVHTIILSIMTVIFAVTSGFICAFLLNAYFSPQFTTQAQYSFSTLDDVQPLNLILIDKNQLIVLLTACFTVGLASAALPIIRNVRRNPIKDMQNK